MRFDLLPLVLAALPVAVSGRGTLGFSLGNKNPDKSCKSTDDYKKDFDALKGLSTLVRTYSASNCHTGTNIMPAAKEKGFKVVLGVWYVVVLISLHDAVLTRTPGPTPMRPSTRTSMC